MVDVILLIVCFLFPAAVYLVTARAFGKYKNLNDEQLDKGSITVTAVITLLMILIQLLLTHAALH